MGREGSNQRKGRREKRGPRIGREVFRLLIIERGSVYQGVLREGCDRVTFIEARVWSSGQIGQRSGDRFIGNPVDQGFTVLLNFAVCQLKCNLNCTAS